MSHEYAHQRKPNYSNIIVTGWLTLQLVLLIFNCCGLALLLGTHTHSVHCSSLYSHRLCCSSLWFLWQQVWGVFYCRPVNMILNNHCLKKIPSIYPLLQHQSSSSSVCKSIWPVSLLDLNVFVLVFLPSPLDFAQYQKVMMRRLHSPLSF